MSGNYNIKTVTARRVEGEAPDWYDPNDYSDVIKVILATGEEIYIDLDAYLSLDCAGKSDEELRRILTKYATGEDLGSTKKGRKDMNPNVRNKLSGKQQLLRKNATRQKVETYDEPEEEVAQPEVRVDFRPVGFPIKIATYYNRVILTDSFIILVKDVNVRAPTQIADLEGGVDLEVSIPSEDIKDLTVSYIDLCFEHDNYEYTVFLIKGNEEQQEVVEEVKEKIREVETLISQEDLDDVDLNVLTDNQ